MILLTTEIYVFDNLTENGTYLAVVIENFRDVSLLFRGSFVLQDIGETMADVLLAAGIFRYMIAFDMIDGESSKLQRVLLLKGLNHLRFHDYQTASLALR